ncbi:hypothetical protein BKA62DRAFT_618644 [Auriculariales sp. MPI-PUGE-AT-0066]|nr:hypothetical protein BKA62DRAFT_618644 [Auriculariales sp. MPI-PUGE-AT-0066]
MDLETKGRVGLLLTALFFTWGLFALILAPVLPSSSFAPWNAISADAHYKYFVVLIVPTTAYFVIANWVGWQYFRNS